MKKRSIAIISDIHGLLEPLEAVLEDIKSRGITEVYSLGDNIGDGPNPYEVMELLINNGVHLIAGNSEEYIRLGTEPFREYFTEVKKQSQLWTLSKLNEHQKGIINLMPHSIELLIGGKKLALCHFASDVRCDFMERGQILYQENLTKNLKAYEQFLYTNSPEQLDEIDRMIEKYGVDSPFVRGYLSAKDDPLFSRKRVDFFDAVIQGHLHWKIYEKGDSTEFYSIRAVGMAYREDPIDTASYVILKEKDEGFDLEEVLVKFDRERMEYSILSSTIPDKTIRKFTCLNKSL